MSSERKVASVGIGGIKKPTLETNESVGYEGGFYPGDSRLEALPIPKIENIAITPIQPLLARPEAQRIIVPEVAKAPVLPLPIERKNPLLLDRPSVDPDAVFQNLAHLTNFHEHGEGMQLHRGGLGSKYLERIGRAKKKSQKSEAASYGVGSLHGEEFVLYGTNWGYMGGSTGVVAGEKFIEAIDMAREKKVPFVGIYASGGMRQDEDFAALEQLGRMIYFEEEFARESRELNIAVLAYKTYGGVSVALSVADVIVGMNGSDFGFAGPDVIQGYQGGKIPEGEQSVELNYERRNIHFLVNDETELQTWLHSMMHHTKHSKAKLTDADIERLPVIQDLSDQERFPFEQRGYSSLLTMETSDKPTETEIFSSTSSRKVDFDDLYLRYKGHESNPYRPDTEYLLKQAFTDVVPLYGRVSDGKLLSYPAIIAAMARIGEKSYMVIGDQPSYQKLGDTIRKIPSSPTPQDFEYLEQMLRIGRKLNIPAVLFTDTFGAKPTVKSEADGQSAAIARAIRAGTRYEPPLISINLGVLGSGGGLATTPRGDRRAALQNTFGCVAEPKSSAAIMLKKVPTDEEVAQYLPTMHATAEELQKAGFIDDIIDEPGGAWEHPERATKHIQDYIVRETMELQGEPWRLRRHKRRQKVRDHAGLPIVYEK